MSKLYHKLAVASVCTALNFTLGANEQAYSAIISSSFSYYYHPDPIITFEVIDGDSFGSFDGLGDRVGLVAYNVSGDDHLNHHSWVQIERTTVREVRALAEFSIPNLTYLSTGARTDTRITRITSAFLRVELIGTPTYDLDHNFDLDYPPSDLGIFGYVGNGTAEASDFEAGVFLDSTFIGQWGRQYVDFNVTPFLNELVTNNNEFAGFAVRALKQNGINLRPEGISKVPPTLIVSAEYEFGTEDEFESVLKLEPVTRPEPVPEPTTIFGSAIGLYMGRWLKRKNSRQQSKIKA